MHVFTRLGSILGTTPYLLRHSCTHPGHCQPLMLAGSSISCGVIPLRGAPGQAKKSSAESCRAPRGVQIVPTLVPPVLAAGFFFGLENILFQGTIIIFPVVILPVIFSSEQPFPVGSLPASQTILAMPVLVCAPVRGEKRDVLACYFSDLPSSG